MKQQIFNDYETLSSAAADLVLETVKQNPGAVLCFATGNTPAGTYRLLAEKARAQAADFGQCFCFGLDEWLGVPPEKNGTCHQILHEQVFKPLGIQSSQVHLFDGMTTDIPAECKKMNEMIRQKGGIDLALVGIGLNGHIGFNEPGVSFALEAHAQELHDSTLASGQHYFSEPTPISRGLTLGLAQLMKARITLLLASGSGKAPIIEKALEGPVTSEVPASLLQQHERALVMMDKAAAAHLTK